MLEEAVRLARPAADGAVVVVSRSALEGIIDEINRTGGRLVVCLAPSSSGRLADVEAVWPDGREPLVVRVPIDWLDARERD